MFTWFMHSLDIFGIKLTYLHTAFHISHLCSTHTHTHARRHIFVCAVHIHLNYGIHFCLILFPLILYNIKLCKTFRKFLWTLHILEVYLRNFNQLDSIEEIHALHTTKTEHDLHIFVSRVSSHKHEHNLGADCHQRLESSLFKSFFFDRSECSGYHIVEATWCSHAQKHFHKPMIQWILCWSALKTN